MALTNSIPELPSDIRLMLDEAIRHAMTGEGDPAILQRIHEEAVKIKREVFEKHGLLDLGTPAIRELRDRLEVLEDRTMLYKHVVLDDLFQLLFDHNATGSAAAYLAAALGSGMSDREALALLATTMPYQEFFNKTAD